MVESPADFKLHCTVDAWKSGDGEDSMRIGGIVSTDQLDKQGERVIQEGLDFSPFLTEGWYNDNHSQKTTGVLGYPTAAKYVRKGERLPNGKQAHSNGWWTEGYLVNTDDGRKTYALVRALAKGPRKLGYSIEGSVIKRDPRNPTTILRAAVRNVAITHCPVNTGTELEALAKALSAGSAISNPGSAPGEGFALRQESVDGAPFGQLGSKANDWETGVDESEVVQLGDGEDADPNNGGWADTDPHQTALRSPKGGTPPGHLTKAEPGDLDVVDELDLLDEMLPAIQRNVREMGGPTKLTKSEARIIVSGRFPHLDSAEIDAIIASAAN